MNFSPIFSFLESLEPYTKTATTALSVISNYRRDKKIELLEEDVKKIKDILGLSEISLSDDELKIISIFIEEAEKRNYTIDGVYIKYNEFKKLDVSEDLDDLLISLESYNFFNVQKFLNNDSNYSLKYEIIINSNLLQKMFNDSLTYSELFKLVVNFIYENYRKEDILYTNKLMEEISLNNFLINPILYHLDLIGVVNLSKTLGNPEIIATHSILNKPNLMTLYRTLNQQ